MTTTLDAEAVLAVIREAVVAVLEVEPGTVQRESRLVEDLQADSLALVEIVEIVEERLAPLARAGFHIDDEDLDGLATVGAAVDYALARLDAVPGPDAVGRLVAALGVPLSEAALTRAMTHRSWAYEQGGVPSNERLEFLGDAVLGLVVADTLFHDHPDLAESRLAPLRASVVNARALADVARALDLGQHLLLGRGEERTGGRQKASILADAVEAVLGAVYLECGFEAARAVVERLFGPLMRAAASLGAGLDWKTSLQELAAGAGQGAPDYTVCESGPDHAKRFTAVVRLRRGPVDGGTVGAELGAGEGATKKEAEQRAAEAAYGALQARAGTHAR